jgi:epsilon-lactone hydrolase
MTTNLERAYTELIAHLSADGLDLDGVRRIFADMVEAQATEPAGVRYETGEVSGHAATWCLPDEAQRSATVVYFHGGGYRALAHTTVRKLAGHLASATRLPIVAVDYRLAPEHPWPAALTDATDILRAIAPRGPVVLAGESAGGSLAISTTLATRERTDLPVAIVAFSPYVDLFGEDDAFADPRSRDAFLSRFAAQDAARMLLADATPVDDPIANLRYADPAGLPPLFLTAGGAENLAPGITAFAERARSASVDTELLVTPDRQHAYVYSAGRDPQADTTIAAAGRWIRSVVGE